LIKEASAESTLRPESETWVLILLSLRTGELRS
jgi:hypothetical protein